MYSTLKCPIQKIPVVYKRIEMSTENAYADEIRNWISTLKTRTDLESIDSEIAKVLKCINQTNYSYNFFRSFSQDPISFFKDWLKNQQQSLQTIHQGNFKFVMLISYRAKPI